MSATLSCFEEELDDPLMRPETPLGFILLPELPALLDAGKLTFLK